MIRLLKGAEHGMEEEGEDANTWLVRCIDSERVMIDDEQIFIVGC